MKTIFLALLFSMIGPALLTATVRHVPADFVTIQAAIDSSIAGDTVLVEPGTYFENINFHGRKVTVASRFIITGDQADITGTIINGSQPLKPDTASVVLFVNHEDTTSILEGFTLTGGTGTVWRDLHNGLAYREGGGILTELSSPVIRNNIIRDNVAINRTGVSSSGGGGIRCSDGNPRIIGNVIVNNRGRYGGGIVLNYTGAIVRNNIIHTNSGGEDYGGSGLWAYADGAAPKIVENNTITNNSSALYGGGIHIESTSATTVNNIVWDNTASSAPQISLVSASVSVSYSDIQGGFTGTGNINVDPQFTDTSHYLSTGSPCIDAGSALPAYNDPEDGGNPGFALAPSRGTIRNDMGAYGGPLRSALYTRLHRNAPRPADHIHAYSDYTTPNAIHVTWNDPTTLVNGKSLSNFFIRVYRDSLPVGVVDSGVQSFTDTGLVRHQYYRYRIGVVISVDSSISDTAGAFAGGHPVPKAPGNFNSTDAPYGVQLTWNNPSQQIDGTPLNDVGTLYIIRDSNIIDSLILSMADTGKARAYADTVQGYHSYQLQVRDTETPSHLSAFTGALLGFGGVATSYHEDFEHGPGGIYRSGTWDTTSAIAKGGIRSLTDSPGGNYQIAGLNYILLPPVVLGSYGILQYQNIAIVRLGHFFYVEISTDHRKTWQTLKVYNWFYRPGWQDGVANPQDWVKFTIDLTPYAGDTATIRFRLFAPTGVPADGVYLDDLFLGPANPVTSDTATFRRGWNMISLPVRMADEHPNVLYPGASSSLFGFDKTYVRRDSLIHGMGYWLKFPSADTMVLTGTFIPADTTTLQIGWNMIGGISAPIDTGSVQWTNSAVGRPEFYVYDHDTGYAVATALEPGKAYWVKVNQATELVLTTLAVAAPSAPGKLSVSAPANKMTLTDADGAARSLGFGAGQEGSLLQEGELPPPPPSDAFDVRFHSQKSFETVSSTGILEFPIDIQSPVYPIVLSWSVPEHNLTATLVVDERAISLHSAGTARISSPVKSARLQLKASSGEAGLPVDFALMQNYPNPFNPATTIDFDLPVTSDVRLAVYDLLGRLVSVPLNGVMEAGRKSVSWNAGALASGIYLYRMEANDVAHPGQTHTAVRAMSFLK